MQDERLFPSLEFWEKTALAALAMEVGGFGLYAWSMHSSMSFAILFLLALAATGGGGVIGFLFGVPRLRADPKIDSQYLPNTNLEQVSDWLTKIIIGATLVQLDDIASAIGRLSSSVAGQIGPGGSASVVASILVFSFVAGFMWSYLWTSFRLKREFDQIYKMLGLTKLAGDSTQTERL